MSNGSIIRLDPEDYDKCSNIWDMSENPEKARKWYADLINGNRVIFVYIENGEFVGEGSLVFERYDSDYTIPKRRIYLSRMIIKRECRNRGIGGMIIDHLVEFAKDLGYEEMSLGVDIDNEPARHLYEKKGFTKVIFQGVDEQGEYLKLVKAL